MHNYGSIDILWLDGGWVRPLKTVNEEVRSWGAGIPKWSQDIDMPHIAEMARAAQPGILIVDRTVHGPYENYQTPEQKIPEQQLDYPWETCMTLANNWGYVPNDKFKPSASIIRSLIEVVAKGGSLLLGIGPKPDGTLPEEAVQRMKEIGEWMTENGEAIYDTRSTGYFHDGNTWFTQNKQRRKMYALVCLKENELMPAFVEWKNNLPAKGTVVKILQTGKKVKWETEENKVKVFLPPGIQKTSSPALAFSFTPAG
jgi:alpha-L-fucosidase